MKRKCRILKSKIKNLQLKKLVLEKRHRRLKASKMGLEKNLPGCDTKSVINAADHVSENAKTFCLMLLKIDCVYSEEEKSISQAIFFKSAATYAFLREQLEFRLPCSTSLYKWLPVKNLTTGIQQNILDKVKNAVSKFDLKTREVVIMFDEMAIKRDLKYNFKYDKIDGYVDFGCGNDSRQGGIGKTICLFMIRSLCGRWKQVISYAVSEKIIPVNKLKILLFENIKACHYLGLTVRATVCDQSTVNQSLYKQLGVDEKNTFFEYEGKKIYCLFDVPHLFKSLRNNLMKYPLKVKNEGYAKWDVIRELYRVDSMSKVRVCPRLTTAHINPNRFQKMNVRLAVQIFSTSCAAGIRTASKLKLFENSFKKSVNCTADTLEKLNRLFDCLNSKTLYSKNPYNTSLQENNTVRTYLIDMTEFISNVKFCVTNKKTKINCLRGLIQTINAVLELSKDLFSEYDDWFYLCTNKLNQDPVENLFSHIRYKKRNPSVYEFNQIIGRIVSVQLMYSSKFANCEGDTDENISLDWNAVRGEAMHALEENDEEQTYSEGEEITDLEHDIMFQSCYSPASADIIRVSQLPDNALRYFTGYVVYKMLKKKGLKDCERCRATIEDQKTTVQFSNEWLIHFKNFTERSDFGSLKAPNDAFFEIIKSHMLIFNEIFTKCSFQQGIKTKIIRKCLEQSKEWYDCTNACYEHRKQILDFFILVLLRKNCSWEIDKTINSASASNERLRSLMQ